MNTKISLFSPNPPTHLANASIVFDIDGTLTATTGVDDECFVAAVRHVLGFTITDTNWGNYTHSTDQGLTLETCQRHLHRPPTPDEITDIKHEFLRLLGTRISAEPARCRQVEGSAAFVAQLCELADGHVGLASGAWAESAKLKLRAAGLNLDHLPSTFSHAHPTGEPLMREEIIASTLRQLGPASTPAIYIGDGVWDARAARALNIAFLGVRHDGIHQRFHAEGVTRIIANYREPEVVLSHIIEALANH